MFFDTKRLFAKAQTSKKNLKLLNFGLARMIPFNKPHGIRIQAIKENEVTTFLPYKRSNFNHIKGMHACALATISEFTTGLVLLNSLDADQYRIIMQRMEMNYHYQGKMDVTANFEITETWLQENVITPLVDDESVLVCCEVKTHDIAGNHISTGNVYWQVKDWKKVRTKA
jgi:acyl-coenzyme A thioesterase PaaI-like protein